MTAPKPSKRRKLEYVCVAEDGISFTLSKKLVHLARDAKIKLTDSQAVPLLVNKLIEEVK